MFDEIYDEMDGLKDDFESEKEMDHWFENGMLILKAPYHSKTVGEENIIDAPFNNLKKDNLVILERYKIGSLK
eukprot:15332896-Ditylum_brightwellii.AAC.1